MKNLLPIFFMTIIMFSSCGKDPVRKNVEFAKSSYDEMQNELCLMADTAMQMCNEIDDDTQRAEIVVYLKKMRLMVAEDLWFVDHYLEEAIDEMDLKEK